jgi:hypothetical protein
MIIRDQFGYLHDVPNRQFVGADESPFGEVVYDGFGDPLGAFPVLAALLPSLLPMITSILPGLIPRPSAPPSPPPSAPAPPFAPEPVAPALQKVVVIREPGPAAPIPLPYAPPGPGTPLMIRRRRVRRRRRAPVRARVERRVTEQLTVPPLPGSAEPLPPPATESSGGLSGYGWWNGYEQFR